MGEASEAVLDPKMVSPAVSRAISHFQNRLHAVSTGAAAAPAGAVRPKVGDAPNPFLGLPRDEFRALAKPGGW